MKQDDLINRVAASHLAKFGSSPRCVAYAPGRVEVLGNHTDYNRGTVLAVAIDSGIAFAVSPSTDSVVRVFAADVEEAAEMLVAELVDSKPPSGWLAYVAGVTFYLRRAGVSLGGLDCTFAGNLPMGSGLSSSAALEVATATAILDAAGVTLAPLEVARLCQRAERDFAGNHCGLLDQLASLHGKADALLHIDFLDHSVGHVVLPEGAAFLIIDSGSRHNLAESEYNARRASCTQAVETLSQLLDRKIRSLRDVSPEDLSALLGRLPETQTNCATHVVGEIDRVARGIVSLEKNDIEGFGTLMFESHQSSRFHFKNSCEALDRVVDTATGLGALGARLTGGGFGGSVIALVEKDRKATFVNALEKQLATQGIKPNAREIVPSSGAGVVERNLP